MVRINLIKPGWLTDQHLIAEYNEILMLLGYVRKHPKLDGTEPTKFCLGKGHIKFFKNKLAYLSKRFYSIRTEMIRRGYTPTKHIDLNEFPEELINDFVPTKEDKLIIIERITEKILMKPSYYTYQRKYIGSVIVDELPEAANE